MDYSVNDIIKDARIALDQNNSSDQLSLPTTTQPLLRDVDTLTLEEIIRSKVEDAARLVEEGAAHWLLDGVDLTGTITWESGRETYVGGSVSLNGKKFLRLVTYRMSDWDRPVIDAITEDNPLYIQQASHYAGVRGNPQSPVVAIVHGANGLQLEFWSCLDNSATIAQAKYVQLPEISGTGDSATINICNRLRDAVVYRIASMTAESIGDANLATVLLKRSMDLSGEEAVEQ